MRNYNNLFNIFVNDRLPYLTDLRAGQKFKLAPYELGAASSRFVTEVKLHDISSLAKYAELERSNTLMQRERKNF